MTQTTASTANQDPDEVTVSLEALDEVEYRWSMLEAAKTPGEQAAAYIALANAMSDLITYHPGYDYELGAVQREDDGA